MSVRHTVAFGLLRVADWTVNRYGRARDVYRQWRRQR